MIDDASGGYYPKRDIKQVLSHLYKLAVIDNYTQRDLSEYIKLPQIPKSTKDAFNADEKAALWKAYESGDKFAAYPLIMICTGMRLGELQKLRGVNVRLDERIIVAAGIKSETGKTNPIFISEKIAPVLSALLPDDPEEKFLRMDEKTFYARYYELLERCGCRRLSPHCCRHTCATDLALANVPPCYNQAYNASCQLLHHDRLYAHTDCANAGRAESSGLSGSKCGNKTKF